jgi:hypothetical protein
MTEGEFLSELRSVRVKWTICPPDGAIRTAKWYRRDLLPGSMHCCPILAVSRAGGSRLENTEYLLAARLLGMPKELADKIVAAADAQMGHDSALRARLLKACKIAEAES